MNKTAEVLSSSSLRLSESNDLSKGEQCYNAEIV